MEYITIQKNITMSPRKVRLVADMVRKMNPHRALDVLQFTNKAAALPVAKAIKTVLANAGTAENLSFVSIQVNEGLKIKRYRVGTAGRGRGRPYRRRLSHIKIVITDEGSQVMPGAVMTAPKVETFEKVETIEAKPVDAKAMVDKEVKVEKVVKKESK